MQNDRLLNRILVVSLVCLAVLGLSACWGGRDIDEGGDASQNGANAFSASAEDEDPEIEVLSNSMVEATATDSEPTLLSIDEVRQKLAKSTVYISAAQKNGASTGSGIIYTPDGYVITNAHVIQKSKKVRVYLEGEQQSLSAEVVGISYCDDLAVIDIEGDGFQPATFGDSDALLYGESVVAMGYPLSSVLGRDLTVSSGEVNRINAQIENLEDTILMDAAINPGNSGGPLANMYGEIIGINTTRINASDGQRVNDANFAIASNFALSILAVLETGENLYQTGIDMMFDESTNRMLIENVDSNSPADKIGIRRGDVLSSINNGAFNTSYGACRLMKEGGYTENGVEFDVMRGQNKLTGKIGGETTKLLSPAFSQNITSLSQMFEGTVARYVQDKLFITDIAYVDEKWSVVFSENSGFTDQRLRIFESYSDLEGLRDSLAQDGYHVTDLAFGNDAWVAVFSEGTSYTEQKIIFGRGFPADEVDELLAEDYAVTSVASGTDRWLLVLSLGSGYNTHEYQLVKGKDLSSKLNELALESKTVSLLVPSDGWISDNWLLAYADRDEYSRQKYLITPVKSNDLLDTITTGNTPTIEALQFLNDEWVILHR